MNIRRRTALTAGASVLTLATALGVPASAEAAGVAAGPAVPAVEHSSRGYGFAVLGDIPYTPEQITGFPRIVDQINADPHVRWVNHLGDIKSGSTLCSDEYFSQIRADFDRFDDPLVYTPGDNEWTDCHRPSNGAYDPLERLQTLRQVFFPHPGRTLGRDPALVHTQSRPGLPENVRWHRARVAFAAVHVVGSNNGLAPWTGSTAPTPRQTAEVLARTAAAVQQIHDAFTDARRRSSRAVVLFMQADMFDPTVAQAAFENSYAFQPIVATIAREARDFRRPVYLFNGDSHVYNQDSPLAAAARWPAFYNVPRAPNLTRITVSGSTDATEYLRVTVNPRGRDVLTWTRVPFEA